MRVRIRVRPGASRTSVGGSYGDGDGALVVAVRARAVDGRATEAALAAVAVAFGVRTRQVRLVSGATSRNKLIEIDGDPAVLTARLAALRASSP
ncbi:MAG TPA: DUF167 domain-containing protein [Actinomycetes bacterium]|nr:DUF167 domain-containing protein [Actinomycetes bacterium]